jgi:hypothetical protein
MSSETPQPSDQTEIVTHKVNTTGGKPTSAPSPKRIEAESQSRNSYERLLIVRILAIGLIVALGLDVVGHFVISFYSPAEPSRPYSGYARDILLVISSMAAYLLGYGSSEKKEDK